MEFRNKKQRKNKYTNKYDNLNNTPTESGDFHKTPPPIWFQMYIVSQVSSYQGLSFATNLISKFNAFNNFNTTSIPA